MEVLPTAQTAPGALRSLGRPQGLGDGRAERPEVRKAAFLSSERRLRRSLAMAGGVAAACARHRQRNIAKARCAAAGADEDAAEELAALEAELEALEDEMEAERTRQADHDEAVTLRKINSKLDSLATPSSSSVSVGAGAKSFGVTGSIAVCGTGEVAELLLERLKQEAPDNQQPVFVNLTDVSRQKFEEVDEALQNCTAAIICPDPAKASEDDLERAKLGLRAVISSAPDCMHKVVLLSHVGAQEGKGGFNLGAFFNQGSGTSWADLEDELTSTVRLRPAERAIRSVIVRAADPPGPEAAASQVRCLPADETGVEGFTSSHTAAEAMLQVINLEVNTNFTLVQVPGTEASDWGELLLPFVGPEVCRIEVEDAPKAVIFLQQWADEFFGPGKSALRQGVKTPVELQKTGSGVLFKFRPLTAKEDPFDSLLEGGLEFVVEEPSGCHPRLRICRCSYGWKVTPKENSERALVDKFQKDWAKVTAK